MLTLILPKKYLQAGVLAALALVMPTSLAIAATLQAKTPYEVCFTPYQHCTKRLVELINNAHESVHLQAFSFTSHPIAHALYRAAQRGVKVKLLLDKSNFTCHHFSFASYFIRRHVPVWKDYKRNIAHNKVIIIDQATVETGSFNFSRSAQYHNAENVLIIHNEPLAKRYLRNWQRRRRASKRVKADPCPQLTYWHVHSP